MSNPDNPPADAAHSYDLTATTTGAGTGVIHTKRTIVRFDSSPRQGDELPGPADLVTAAFAACIIKNIERMSEILPFSFRSASVQVHSVRQDRPPRITRIHYAIEVDTDEPDHRLALLHRNIEHHGTIFNTLASACNVSGTIVAAQRKDGASPAG
jgi:uncharacterized OsmC-like protein